MKKIAFNPNSAELQESSFTELEKLLNELQNNNKIKIEISGHTSKTKEGEEFNQKLSLERADAVKKYLCSKGIDGTRIVCKGFGYSRPLFSENDEDHQALNRRVEILVLEE